MYEQVIGVPKDKNNACYLPNAAIAWKQPNGFYYPPAFHSQNLFFDKVPIRHYVVEPSFAANQLFKTDLEAAKTRYCNFNNTMFNNFSDIDRQTELNDDDGSLTGLVKTISVNQDAFFNAPYATLECASDIATAKPTIPPRPVPAPPTTSPYDYVSTVIFPNCGSNASCNGNDTPGTNWNWSSDCANNTCFGVPLYRELVTGSEKTAKAALSAIRMMGENFFQRNTLTVNSGVVLHGYDRQQSQTDRSRRRQLHRISGKHDHSPQGLQRLSSVREADHHANLRHLCRPRFQPGHRPQDDPREYRRQEDQIPYSALLPCQTTWSKSYKDGVLTVTVNMNFDQFIDDYNDERMASCQPNSFCKWTGTPQPEVAAATPRRSTIQIQNLIKECNGTNDSKISPNAPSKPLPLCSWSVADVVCPGGRLLWLLIQAADRGFPGPKPGLPPAGELFSRTSRKRPVRPGTCLSWRPAVRSSGGLPPAGCFYSPTPSPDFCP